MLSNSSKISGKISSEEFGTKLQADAGKVGAGGREQVRPWRAITELKPWFFPVEKIGNSQIPQTTREYVPCPIRKSVPFCCILKMPPGRLKNYSLHQRKGTRTKAFG